MKRNAADTSRVSVGGGAALAAILGTLAALALALAPGLVFAQTFHVAPTYDAGVRPPAIVFGDFNEDGDADMAAADSGSNLVSILLGDGTGAYGAAVTFPVGSFPRAMVTADLDDDGHLDLAVANWGSNSVTILLGDGAGSFAAAGNFPAGGGVFSLAAADFNGDTNPDLAVANSTGSSISILLGNGSGGFGAPSSFAAGLIPRAVTAGKLNGDAMSVSRSPTLIRATFRSCWAMGWAASARRRLAQAILSRSPWRTSTAT
jgi:hypothetical protein